jgi:hypothetical protein
LKIEVIGSGGDALVLVLSAHQTRKGLLVVGDVGALVVGSADAHVREGVLKTVSAYALKRGTYKLRLLTESQVFPPAVVRPSGQS